MDNRPCNTEFPEYLAQIALLQLETATSRKAFQKSLPKADAAVLSVERWVYGGLVESRSPQFTESFVKAQLATLQKLLQQTSADLDAFTILMRQAPTAFNAEEEKNAAIMKQASMAYHNPDERLKLIQQLPKNAWNQYLSARKRNLKVNQTCIQLTQKNLIQCLAIALDDLASTGLNQDELKLLQQEIRKRKLENKIHVLPGADEMGMLLLTRRLVKASQKSPKIFPIYSLSNPDRFKLRYEDRSLSTIVHAQIQLIGGKIAGSKGESDLFLFVHAPQEDQRDVPAQPAEKISKTWLQELTARLQNGDPCVLADVRYANGADKILMQTLAKQAPLSKLFGFSAWNTTANALGIALSHGTVRWLAGQNRRFETSATSAHRHFLSLRFLEDWLYQAEIRPQLPHDSAITPELANQVRAKLNLLAKKTLHHHFKALTVHQVEFPWKRLFELSLALTVS